jgi:hypothetical protein
MILKDFFGQELGGTGNLLVSSNTEGNIFRRGIFPTVV